MILFSSQISFYPRLWKKFAILPQKQSKICHVAPYNIKRDIYGYFFKILIFFNHFAPKSGKNLPFYPNLKFKFAILPQFFSYFFHFTPDISLMILFCYFFPQIAEFLPFYHRLFKNLPFYPKTEKIRYFPHLIRNGYLLKEKCPLERAKTTVYV